MAKNKRIIIHNVPYSITCSLQDDVATSLDALARCTLDALARVGDRWGASLHGYVIMPDHWHALISTQPPHDLSRVMNDVKAYSSLLWGQAHEQPGGIWCPRFYDHICRDDRDYARAMNYLHYNPVRADLVSSPEEWPWSSWYAYADGGEPPLAVVPIVDSFDIGQVACHRHPPPARRSGSGNNQSRAPHLAPPEVAHPAAKRGLGEEARGSGKDHLGVAHPAAQRGVGEEAPGSGRNQSGVAHPAAKRGVGEAPPTAP